APVAYAASAPGVVTYAADAFGRSSTAGWGSADVGNAYALTGGAASDFVVSGGVGTMLVAAGGSAPAAVLSDVSARDVDVTLRIAMDKVASGTSQYVYLLVRRAQGGLEYRGQVRFTNSGGVALQVVKNV